MAHRRRQLTDKEIKWLKDHFKHTKNDDIKAKLGITHSYLADLAKLYGLKKTVQFIRQQRAECCRRMQEFHCKQKAENTEWYRTNYQIRVANIMANRNVFKKGESNKDRMSPKRYRQMVDKVASILASKREKDRARVAIGLKPLTKLSTGIPTKERTAMYRRKQNLRSYGYICPKIGLTIYYDANTKRSPFEDKYKEKYRMKFVSIDDLDEKQRVVIVPDWTDKQGGFNE